MSLTEVIKAVCDRWDDQTLDEEVTNGLHLGEAPKDTEMPFCVLQEPTAGNIGHASRQADTSQETEYERIAFRLVIHSAGGAEAIETAVAAVKTAYKNAPLSLASATLLLVRQTGERMVNNPTDRYPNAVLWALEFDVLVAGAVDLAPS